jgi:hypothetical protein
LQMPSVSQMAGKISSRIGIQSVPGKPNLHSVHSL